ncbi:Zinc/iron permease [Mytilinidion resinicola]|uniref:Zinc/iron permease n=1 Tax=Mytilinidion resinicola TaxID=574789 RepID=A0A6A6Y691_9PEZI|nr:Zinc/iron permease [Mytilinidion resinicola]KAF2804048.1 Zinc/iron permease [Mytilinidion resinicola]
MWDGLFMLLALSTLMAIASFLAGALPLSLALSQRQLRFVSALGTGVLVGTALIVIIPEGIETLYSIGKKGHSHDHAVRSVKLPEVQLWKYAGTPQTTSASPLPTASEAVNPDYLELRAVKAPGVVIVPRAKDAQDAAKDAQDAHDEDDDHPKKPQGDDDSSEGDLGKERIHPQPKVETPEEHKGREPHAWVGVSLVLGFILMYLVDVLPDTLGPSQPKYRPLHIDLSNLSRGSHHSNSPGIPSSPAPGLEPPSPRSSATTIGLIIHAFADGIALGASTTAPSTSLGFIVFLAIMLHKAPAAFGLTSVLLKQGISKRTARTHLLLFSLAAPAGAFVTWSAVHLLGRARLGGDDGLTWATGCILLFSGGTFLYVAMHSMTDSAATPTHSHDFDSGSNGYADPYSRGPAPKGGQPSASEVATAVVGMLVPLVTQIGHVH